MKLLQFKLAYKFCTPKAIKGEMVLHAKRKELAFFRLFSFAVVCGCLLIFSCNRNDKIDIRNYYFPLKSLQEGVVYEYRAIDPDS